MRRFLARIVVAFANIVTFSLSPPPKGFVRIMVRDGLAEKVPVVTPCGELVFCENSPPSAWILNRRRKDTCEPDTQAWIDAMPEDACFRAIGANIGVFSLYAALRLPSGRVVAFEPAAGSYAALNRNIEANGMAHRVSACCVALAERTRLDTLNMATTRAGSRSHGFGTEIDEFGNVIDTKFRQGAAGFSIDDFAAQFSPPLPTHVKMDVDGILRGGRAILSAPSVRSAIIELRDLDSPRSRGIADLLAEPGFERRPNASPDYRNIVFDRALAAGSAKSPAGAAPR